MGYTLSAYVIDVDRLRAASGSGDKRLLRSVIKSNPDEFDDEDDFPEGSSRLPLATALEHIINGESLGEDYTQYAYALEELCRYLGVNCLADRWDICTTGVNRILETGPPIELPPKADFPSIGVLARAAVADELKRAEVPNLYP